MYCNNCGTKNPDGAKFCYECGARMNVPETPRRKASEKDPDKEKFRKKLRHSIKKDAEGLLDFVVIQVADSGFVQFAPMEAGGFYVEFAVGDFDDPGGRYRRFDKLYRQYGYRYGTGDPNDDFYVKEYPKGGEEDLIQEIPDLIVAIKGNCLSACLYDESLNDGDDYVPVPPAKKRSWLFSINDVHPLLALFKMLLMGIIVGTIFGGIMFILSEYYW